MPPANSPSDDPREAAPPTTAPATTTATSPYLDQLAELASPVPDFAATLMTQAEQDADEDNVSFLRTQPSAVASSSGGVRASAWMSLATLTPGDSNPVDLEGHARTRWAVEVVAGHRRYTAAQLRELGHPPETEFSPLTSYEESRYQGWAPGGSDYDEDVGVLRNTSQARARVHHESRSPRRSPRRESGSQRDMRMPHLSPISSPERSRSGERELDDASEMGESSLRTTALLHSLHRGPQFSSRARNQRQHSVVDSDRTASDDEYMDMPRLVRVNSSGSTPRSHRQAQPQLQYQTPPQRQHQNLQQQRQQQQQQQQMAVLRQQQQVLQQEQQPRQQRQHRHPQREPQTSHEEDMQERDEAYHAYRINETLNMRPSRVSVHPHRRQMYIEASSPNPPTASRSLDDAIQYLERLRFCESLQESLSSAKAGGFGQDELFANSDFLLDTTTIEPPPESSWLKIGGVLSGSQHAAGGPSLAAYLPNPHAANVDAPHFVRVSQQPTPNSTSQASGSTRMEQGPRAPHPISDGDEEWPVKVTIHNIDYNSMTLSGTMEAFNVPDKSSPTQESSITTFLEGEIIDFNTYTLETKTFEAGARVDGTYWRKLEPFKKLTDNEIVRSLVSKKWFTEELLKNWILMRWKEKCFVTPSDAQSSLTISGFYYISLRRSDGHVEGLYYDPSSTPYQHLTLVPEKRTFPAYRFQ